MSRYLRESELTAFKIANQEVLTEGNLRKQQHHSQSKLSLVYSNPKLEYILL